MTVLHRHRAGRGVAMAAFPAFRILAFLACLVPLVLSGCASLRGAEDGRDYRTYAEDVFRHQNQVSSRLLLLIMDHHNDDQLLQAEQRLLKACGPLNHIAIRKMKNQSANLMEKYRTRMSIRECDDVTRDVERMLESYPM